MTLTQGNDPFAWLVLLAILVWFDRARWRKRLGPDLGGHDLGGRDRSSFRYRQRY